MNGKTVKILRKIFLRVTPKDKVTQAMWRLFKKEHNNRTHREKGKFKKWHSRSMVDQMPYKRSMMSSILTCANKKGILK